jgi:hypothetical protein
MYNVALVDIIKITYSKSTYYTDNIILFLRDRHKEIHTTLGIIINLSLCFHVYRLFIL